MSDQQHQTEEIRGQIPTELFFLFLETCKAMDMTKADGLRTAIADFIVKYRDIREDYATKQGSDRIQFRKEVLAWFAAISKRAKNIV